ncbi:MAG TPA: c-type cytochrome [Polaromonas sp.]|uniref:c-type cytochrome n=1 Tax=Polaromonas sp. TaxID=1869339 RepID=UPI002D703918|nr:c-type cytochrome [Polaromonas sp.]HYW58581.1 c-type cytochrome [Polaromonas sp.]
MSAKPRSSRRRWIRGVLLAIACPVLIVILVAWLNVRGEESLHGDQRRDPKAAPSLVEKGAYLARAGNCMGCHSTAGGTDFAGGHGVQTPFGTVYASNLTPDPKTGMGSWTDSEFWRAMHHGRSKDGRLLYPAFPYPSYTNITREDSDALFAYLRTIPAVERANRAHELRFPYNTQAALAIWRAMFFRPGTLEAPGGRTAEWQRGRYLVDGLAHCAACHSSRNFLGGTSLNTEFAGGLMPDKAWYAPSLASPNEAGLQKWSPADAVKLLKDGVASHGGVSGPMADVVYSSTQYLSEQDLKAMVAYLASIAVHETEKKDAPRASSDVMVRGAKIYDQKCAACHGDKGQGATSMYPALAGNRAVLLDSPNNLVQIIRRGGFYPSTPGNPRPFGMPPFKQVLSNEEIAALTTYIRQSWGNAAPALSTLDVQRVQ